MAVKFTTTHIMAIKAKRFVFELSAKKTASIEAVFVLGLGWMNALKCRTARGTLSPPLDAQCCYLAVQDK